MNIEDYFICQMCKTVFDDFLKIPRLLPDPDCGHTFCTECLAKKLSSLKPDELFTCPNNDHKTITFAQKEIS